MPDAEAVVQLVREEMRGRMPHDDIRHLFTLKQKMGPSCRSYLEIGTYHGASLCVVLQSPQPTRFVTIDLFKPNIGHRGSYVDAGAPDVRIARDNVRRLNVHAHPVRFIRGNSHSRLTWFRVATSRYDFLFIDGDHSEQGVIRDFTMYYPLLRPGALVVFDDSDYDSVRAAITRIHERFPMVSRRGTLGREYVVQKPSR
jgi:predicted O-methyltransferase YrrM